MVLAAAVLLLAMIADMYAPGGKCIQPGKIGRKHLRTDALAHPRLWVALVSSGLGYVGHGLKYRIDACFRTHLVDILHTICA